ncbi:hypothetical protein, partial [Salmonella enterica]|uniref:hypothetical protein n=1 Tax=Salmonella enterica TaxID=28901 RepID=UPI000AED1331
EYKLDGVKPPKKETMERVKGSFLKPFPKPPELGRIWYSAFSLKKKKNNYTKPKKPSDYKPA